MLFLPTPFLTHVIEGEVDISAVLSFNDVLESYKIVMSCQSLQVHDLSERTLRIGGVAEGVEALLQSEDLTSPLLDGLPHNAIRLRSTYTRNRSSPPSSIRY